MKPFEHTGRALTITSAVVAVVALIVGLINADDANKKSQRQADRIDTDIVRSALEARTDDDSRIIITSQDRISPAARQSCAEKNLSDSKDELTAKGIETQTESIRKTLHVISDRLSNSGYAEHLHLAALIDKDPQTLVELVNRSDASDGANAMLLWDSLNYCSQPKISGACPLRELEERILIVDGQNSETLIRIAANRYASGNLDEALRLLRRASTSAVTNDYWTQRILLIERGLAAGSDFPFAARAEMAIGIAAAQPAFFGDYIKMCREQSAISSEWAYACAAYGRLGETQGKTMMTVGIAQAIQKLAYEGLGETGRVAEVEARMQSRRQAYSTANSLLDDKMLKVVFSSPTLFSAYLATLDADGELVAFRKTHEDVERLQGEQSEPTCDATQ